MRLDGTVAQLTALAGPALNDEAGDLQGVREAPGDVRLVRGVQADTAKPAARRR